MGLKNVSKIDTNRVELEVEVGAEPFEEAVKRAYKRNVGRFTIPGFRKGKAPRQLIEKCMARKYSMKTRLTMFIPRRSARRLRNRDMNMSRTKSILTLFRSGRKA